MVIFNKDKYNFQYALSINKFYGFGYHKFNLNQGHNVSDNNGFFQL